MEYLESRDEIVISQSPVIKWVKGALAALLILLLLLFILYCVVFNRSLLLSALDISNTQLFIYLTLLIAAIFIVLPYALKNFPLFAPKVTLSVNRISKSIEIHYDRLYGRKTRHFAFHQVSKFKSKRVIIGMSPRYHLVLILVNRKKITLRLPLGDKAETVKLIKHLNKFIRTSPNHQ